MSGRKIVWFPSAEHRSESVIAFLEKRLAEFYSNTPSYYTNIDFTSNYWIDVEEVGFRDIVETAKQHGKILEIGCGSSNILKYHSELKEKYFGCDFSHELLDENQKRYPYANFVALKKPNLLPFSDSSFDMVFSVFVLEHSANPSLLLDESVRVLKENGILIVLCPDFLGYGRMTSQRAGFSAGTSTEKLKKKKYLDALITLFDNRLKIPAYCKYLSYKSLFTPKFYINICPTVFSDNFSPDVDAVYVTSKNEIVKHLEKSVDCLKNSLQLKRYEQEKKLIYLKFKKNVDKMSYLQ